MGEIFLGSVNLDKKIIFDFLFILCYNKWGVLK